MGSFGRSKPISKLKTGIRAEQVNKGTIHKIIFFSRSEDKVRAAITEGMAQAKPESNGTNDLPLNPIFCKS